MISEPSCIQFTHFSDYKTSSMSFRLFNPCKQLQVKSAGLLFRHTCISPLWSHVYDSLQSVWVVSSKYWYYTATPRENTQWCAGVSTNIRQVLPSPFMALFSTSASAVALKFALALTVPLLACNRKHAQEDYFRCKNTQINTQLECLAWWRLITIPE